MSDFTYATTFTEQFQAHMLAVAARVPGFVLKYRSALHHEYYTSATHRTVARALFAYVDKWATLPTKELLKDLCKDYARNADALQECRTYIAKAYQREIPDAQAVMLRTIEFGKQQAMCNAVMKAAERIQRGDHSIMPLIHDATLVGQDVTDLGLDWSHVESADHLSWYTAALDASKLITTGNPYLDHAMGGGLGRGELGVVFGPPKRGKSMALVNVAFGALCAAGALQPDGTRRPYKVAVYSCEMSRERWAMRVDSRLCGKFLDYRTTNPAKFVEKVAERKQAFVKGNLFIKSYPTRTMTPALLRTHLSLLAANDFKPDLLIVDYADIMKAERRLGEMRHEQASIYEDLRAIAQEFDCACWTASQANRGAMNKATLGIEDLAEAFEKAAIADALLAYAQSKEEQEAGEARLVMAALRNAQDGGAVKCIVRKNMALVQGVGYYDVAGLPVLTDGPEIPEVDKEQAAYTTADLKTDPTPQEKDDEGDGKGFKRRKREEGDEPTKDLSKLGAKIKAARERETAAVAGEAKPAAATTGMRRRLGGTPANDAPPWEEPKKPAGGLKRRSA